MAEAAPTSGTTAETTVDTSAPTITASETTSGTVTPTMITTTGTTFYTAVDTQIILVGGLAGGVSKLDLGEKYCANEYAIFMDKKHRHSPLLTHLPPGLQENISVCAAQDGFIVSGIVKNKVLLKDSVSLRVKRFSIKDQVWSDLPDMLYVCSEHGSVCVDNHFFTVGGRSTDETYLSNVSMLDIGSLALRDCDSLVTAVTKPGIVAVDAEFLVLGGHTNSRDYCTQVCKYDAHTGKRTSCQPMPKPCYCANRTAASGKQAFVLQHDGTLFMMYNMETDQWSQLRPLIKPVNWSAMVFFNGRLVVTGGYGKEAKTVQTYDVENATWWLEVNKLPIGLNDHTAIVSYVPPFLEINNSFDHVRFWVFSLPPLYFWPLVVLIVTVMGALFGLLIALLGNYI